MTKSTQHQTLTACALAATLFLAACGGGTVVDTTPPTVAITSAAGTGGAVTFTFAFSEDVGVSFTADDVTVTGGTKAATVTKVDATHYTLSVTPDANAGGITATLTAGKVADLAQNANAVGGESSFLPAITKLSFDETTSAITGTGAYGGAVPTVEAGPAGSTGNALKIVKPAGQEIWGGVYFTTGGVSFTADRKKISAKVYATRANSVVKFKVEATDGSSVEVAGTTTGAANTWSTVTWDLSAVDLAKTYKVIAITPDADVATTGVAYYIDDITLDAAIPASTLKTFTFSEAGIGFGPFENPAGGTVEIVTDPTDAGNKVVKFVKKAGDGDYFGTTVTGLGGSVVLTSAQKTVTMRVYSPAAGTNFLLKFEGGTGGPATTEKDAVTTVAGAWETLSFVMSDVGTYSTVVVFPHGRSAVTADTTMLMDDLTFPEFSVTGGGTGGGTGSGFVGGVFADDYVGSLDPAANSAPKSTQGGDFGFYFDPRLAKNVGATYDYGGVSGTAQDPAGVHNFYYGLGLNAPAITNAYFGAFVKAPGNSTVNVATFSNILVNVWGPDQLFKPGVFPALEVVLSGPVVPGCTSASGGSEVTKTFNTTAQGAAQIYTLPLSGFALKASCSGETNVAQVLASIAQFNVNLLNTNIQYVNKDPDGTAFTNGLNIGSIKFN